MASNGQVRSVNRNGMHIERNLHGGRTITSERGGKRIVTTGGHGGYVQKSYMTRGGHSYYQRTYYDHGHYRTGVYRGYSYGGHVYYGYSPAVYYGPAFYGWAYNPWADPVVWGVAAWGWAGEPWYGYYGFAPYPTYYSPAFWLTDYLIAANLQAAYAAMAEVPVAPVVPVAAPLAISTNVIANQPWTVTGVPVVQGQTYTIMGGGFINYNPNAVAAPTGVQCGGQGGLLAPQFPCISMLGKIGPYGAPFFVGNGTTFVAPMSGELFLGVNDRYFGDNGGAWQATITSSAAVAPIAPVVASVPALPPVLNECEGPYCGTWTWDGTHYNAVWNQGSVAVLTVVKWDGQSIVLSRVDPAGTTAGNSSTYTGVITGPNTASGSEQGVYQGNPWSFGWTITSPSALLLTPSPNMVAAAQAESSESARVEGSDPVTMTPEIKQAIAEEVKAQLQTEQLSARRGGRSGPGSDANTNEDQPSPANDVPPALDPARRTFIVSTDLAVVSDGQECSLTQGDVLTRLSDKPDADQKVNVSISASKKNDCAAGKLVAVSVDDLQEMRNHFEEQLDDGLKALASKQGTGKMPKSPNTNTVAGDVPAPSPDTSAAKDLQQQQASADQTETEVKQEASAAGGGA